LIPDKKTVVRTAVGSGVLGILYGADPVAFVQRVTEVAQNQIAQAGFFFTFAAIIHSRAVKKEISAQFSILTTAINGVATALRQDLAGQSNRVDKVESGITELGAEFKQAVSRIDALEKKP
jgi:hypothetical protein